MTTETVEEQALRRQKVARSAMHEAQSDREAVVMQRNQMALLLEQLAVRDDVPADLKAAAGALLGRQ